MSNIPIFTTFHAFSAGALWLLGTLVLLGVNQTNTKADRWLSLFFYLMASLFTRLFLEGLGIQHSILLHVLELPSWAIFPCFYMAVRYLVDPQAKNKDWPMHFFPFFAFLLFSLVYLMPIFFNVSHQQPPQLPPWIQFSIRYFFFAQTLLYWIACYLLLRRHRKNIQQVASFTEKINLQWLQYLLIAILLLIAIRLLDLFSPHVTYYIPAGYFLGIILLAYFTLTQQSIYNTESPQLIDAAESPQQKIAHERLTPSQVEELKQLILREMNDKKFYLDPSLTLSILSTKLGINSHDLSYILNNGLHKSFYQFINELRTEEAKVLLLSDDTRHLDLLGIATRAGFNSKTTFYTTFKKSTGITPKAYIDRYSRASSAQ